ncbi:MAG: aminoacyl-tRNA hydrolase [Deltaproteobacteria bacterium TMED126]|nr:aminoacyl-tRNA hydrolase [Candidatus Dadabacteria bacterium]NSW97277.1 aminoacyl-tRNA hydrolase [Deltaproteobacteria bacterium TMED126]
MEDLFNQYLIIGLGNPGQKYKDTRHNIGFKLIDTLLDSNSMSNKFKSLYSKIEINKNSIHIVKPQTFMNESGVAVNEITKFFKIKQENIIVVYDDLDLPIGNLKIKIGGGSAGHNGIKSIEKYIETEKIIKIRIGIGKPVNKAQINSHVLSKFTHNENILLKPILQKFEKIIEDIILEGISFAMNKFNSKIQ